jgi:hypothetical protein
MDFGELIPIAGMIAGTSMFIAWLSYLRTRQTGRAGAAPDVATARENAQLAHENEGLRLTVGRLEERIAVLERIATDPAERTAREIEQLR